jgi:N-acetylneuraminic acid mutarotase
MVTLGAEGGVLLTGGETAPPPLGGEVLTDTWTLSQAGWTNLTRCPSPPWGEGAAYDAESERVILIGGVLEGWTEVREVWTFDPTSAEWTRSELDDGPDFLAKVSYDAESERVVTFDRLGDTWAYDFNSNAWQEMRPSSSPPGRDAFAMAYDAESDRVIVFGGYGNSELGDTWAYDYNTNTWTAMTPAEGPEPRDFHAMVYVPTTDRIILYGGGDNVGHDDTWAYDYNTNTWTEMAPEFSPGLRSWHSMAYDAATEMVVFFGGASRRDPHFHDDTWMYDPSANTWSPLGGVVVGGVTLATDGCQYTGPTELPAGDVTFRLRNKTSGQFDLDVYLLDAGHDYEEFAAHIDEERRRGEEGEPPLGHPAFATLLAESTAEEGINSELVTDVAVGAYGMACIYFDQPGSLGGIWAAGPITVAD